MSHSSSSISCGTPSTETKNKSQQLLAPEIVRALTELFLAVENQAEVRVFAYEYRCIIYIYICSYSDCIVHSGVCVQHTPCTQCVWLPWFQEWGVSQAMMIETLTKEGLGTWLEKGISNVAFLSLGLGLDNTASRAFIEAKVSECMPLWL